MDILICMSLGGSLIIAGYILLKHCKLLSLKSSWYFLLAAAGFFLIPYPKFLYSHLLPVFRPLLFAKSGNYILKDATGKILYWQFKGIYLSAAIVIIGFLAIFIRQFYLSRKYQKKIERNSSEENVRKLGWKKVKVLYSDAAQQPITMGIIHSAIVLPENDLEPEEEEMVIRHELQHIKAGDLIINVMAVILISLHWYNPLVYYMVREMKHVQELKCDFAVTKNMNEEQRLKYSNLILAFARKTAESNALISTLSGDKKKLWERMDKIMTGNRKKRGAGWMIPILTILCIFSSVLTTLAYDAPYQVSLEEGKEISDFGQLECESMFFTVDTSLDMELVSDIEGMDLFIAENGETFYCDPNASAQTWATCSHTYVSGEYRKHVVSGTGCKVYIYSAKRCTKCGNVVIGDLLNVITYQTCPH